MRPLVRIHDRAWFLEPPKSKEHDQTVEFLPVNADVEALKSAESLLVDQSSDRSTRVLHREMGFREPLDTGSSADHVGWHDLVRRRLFRQ
jgi:hypothetical protein